MTTRLLPPPLPAPVLLLLLFLLLHVLRLGPHSASASIHSHYPDNTLIWKERLDAACVSTPSLSPDGRSLLIGCNNRQVYSILTENGHIAWNVTMMGRVQASPTISRHGVAYVGSQHGDVVAMNATTGAQLWKVSLQRGLTGRPALSPDEDLLFVNSGQRLHIISTSRSFVLSSYEMGGPIETAPLVDWANRVCYVACSDSFLYAIDISNIRRPKLRWRFRTGDFIDLQSSPALSPDRRVVYVGGYSKKLHAVDTMTGRCLWSFAAKDTVASPAVGSDGTIFVGSSDRNLYALHPNGMVKWQQRGPAAIQGQPGVYEGGGGAAKEDLSLVTVGTSGTEVYSLWASSGERLWSFTTGGWVVSSPVFHPEDCTIYFGSIDRHIYRVGRCHHHDAHHEEL